MEITQTQQNVEKEQYRDAMSPFGRFVKRLFDIVVAFTGMVVMSPVFIVIYIAIICEDGYSAIFRQNRIGRGGKKFKIYKFRSMIISAEEKKKYQLCAQNDDRLTRVGRFIREHHLDELPQLWNVVKGDMSLVGYRPERRHFIEQIMERDARYKYLYQIRPGVFSEATLYNGYTDTMEKMLTRLQMDLDYLTTRTVWCDLKIIFLTAISIISGKKF